MVASARATTYNARMASPTSRRATLSLHGICWLVAAIGACGPSGSAVDTSTGEATQGSGSGTTNEAPTSGGSSTASVTEASTSTGVTGASSSTSTSTSTSTTTGTSSTGTDPVGTTTTETSAGPVGTTVEATTADESASSSSTGTGEPVQCQAPVDCEPLFFTDPEGELTDVESGWVACHEGQVIYREEPVDCAHEVFWPECEGQEGDCATDEDCPGNQACRNIWGSCSCTPQCMSDSDCGDGEICVCTAEHPELPLNLDIKNTCNAAGCAGQADCEGECGCRGDDFCGYTISAFCPTLNDECSHAGDCDPGKICTFDGAEQRWRCFEPAICE